MPAVYMNTQHCAGGFHDFLHIIVVISEAVKTFMFVLYMSTCDCVDYSNRGHVAFMSRVVMFNEEL